MAGIHTGAREEIIDRIKAGGFRVLRNDEFHATEVIPTREDYALFLSRMPGNPDYTEPERFEQLAPPPPEGYRIPRWWFIWVGGL